MSEAEQAQGDPTVETGRRASVAVVNGGEDVEMTFADGRRVVPRWIVAELGGREKFKAAAAAFARFTYEQFTTQFNRRQEQKTLNKIGARYVAAALSGRGGFPR